MVIGHISSSLPYANYLRIKNLIYFWEEAAVTIIIRLMMATLEYRLEQCYMNISSCINEINPCTEKILV